MPYAFGNKHAEALPTTELRLKAFDSFCEHLAQGYHRTSWCYDDGKYMCCYKTLMTYVKSDPTVFPIVKQSSSLAKGQKLWEKVLSDSATGENPKANTASLQMIMRNKYGWDKKEEEREVDSITPEQLQSLIDKND